MTKYMIISVFQPDPFLKYLKPILQGPGLQRLDPAAGQDEGIFAVGISQAGEQREHLRRQGDYPNRAFRLGCLNDDLRFPVGFDPQHRPIDGKFPLGKVDVLPFQSADLTDPQTAVQTQKISGSAQVRRIQNTSGKNRAFRLAEGLHGFCPYRGRLNGKQAHIDGVIPPRQPQGGSEDTEDVADCFHGKAASSVGSALFQQGRNKVREDFCRHCV